MEAHKADRSWLEPAVSLAAAARVTVFGDFCLDAYWTLDEGPAELSLETDLPVCRVRQQRYSLGAAGNVAANLADLGVARVTAVGLVGADLFGGEMRRLLQAAGIEDALEDGDVAWQTPVYAKPHLAGAEQSRVDFGAFNVLTDADADRLAEALSRVAGASDAVVLNQQLPAGVSTEAMIERINDVVARHPETVFLVDARHRPGSYRGVVLKINSHEAAALVGEDVPLDQPIPHERASELASRQCERTGKAVFITRGEDGLIVAHKGGLHVEPGVVVSGPTDPVGAGDTVASALAAVLGAGGDAVTAARLANLAAAVTVTKLQTTGTASPDEIRAAAAR